MSELPEVATLSELHFAQPQHHKRSLIASLAKKYACRHDGCSYETDIKSDLNKHKRTCQKGPGSGGERPGSGPKTSPAETHKCTYRGHESNRKEDIKRHQVTCPKGPGPAQAKLQAKRQAWKLKDEQNKTRFADSKRRIEEAGYVPPPDDMCCCKSSTEYCNNCPEAKKKKTREACFRHRVRYCKLTPVELDLAAEDALKDDHDEMDEENLQKLIKQCIQGN